MSVAFPMVNSFFDECIHFYDIHFFATKNIAIIFCICLLAILDIINIQIGSFGRMYQFIWIASAQEGVCMNHQCDNHAIFGVNYHIHSSTVFFCSTVEKVLQQMCWDVH